MLLPAPGQQEHSVQAAEVQQQAHDANENMAPMCVYCFCLFFSEINRKLMIQKEKVQVYLSVINVK